ncbi:MAG: LCP family protein [Clostridia bacterium]|nr:LCP family protein [Clostridia bacterium]
MEKMNNNENNRKPNTDKEIFSENKFNNNNTGRIRRSPVSSEIKGIANADNEMVVKKTVNKRKKRKLRTSRKKNMYRSMRITAIILISVMVLILGLCVAWKLTPGSFKINMIKEMSKSQFLRNLIAVKLENDYVEKFQDTDFNEADIVVDEVVKKKLKGYKNIALFGFDARDNTFDSGTRSDTIIIVSINNETGAVKMVSVYRDCYLKIFDENGSTNYFKVNSAFSKGGAQAAISTLNANLDLNITDYIMVNFAGLTEIVDIMDGVDINITDAELELINLYSTEMCEVTGDKYKPLKKSGNVHLNGVQATAYCRIRYVAFYDASGNVLKDDFGRTARQRLVMEKLIAKAKSSGVKKLLSLTETIMNLNTAKQTYLKTSLDYDEIMDFVPILIDYNLDSSGAFPYTISTPTVDGASLVVAKGLAYNVSVLHKNLFGDENYEPSASVVEISEYIEDYTDVHEQRLPE